MKVALIGLGRMGQAIAANVLNNGHEVTVYNRSAGKGDELVKAGATEVRSVADAVANCEFAITMLAHDTALEAIALGPDGVVQSLPKDAVHLAMGTHGVDISRKVAQAHEAAGGQFVAAPVLGRPDVAEQGNLGVVPAGPAEIVEKCQPLIDIIGRRTFHAGTDPGAAASMKLANNFVLGCAIEVMGEAMSLVRKYGVEPEIFYNVMTDALFDCPAYKIYGDIIAKEDYGRVGITATLGLKDANLAMAAAEAAGVPLPSAAVWRDRLIGAISHGDGEKDWAVVALDQARASALEK